MSAGDVLGPRPATLEDVGLVGGIAAAGFADDPVMCWALPDPARRSAQLIAVFEGLTRDVLPDRGLVHLLGEQSVALWRDPDFRHGAPADEEPASPEDSDGPASGTEAPQDAEPSPFSAENLERFAELDRVMHAAHPTERHWYLNVVATLPEHQGKGLGVAVLAPVLSRADADGLPCYLESSNPRNHDFYRRLGFEDRDELPLPDGPSLLAMWRPPGAGSRQSESR